MLHATFDFLLGLTAASLFLLVEPDLRTAPNAPTSLVLLPGFLAAVLALGGAMTCLAEGPGPNTVATLAIALGAACGQANRARTAPHAAAGLTPTAPMETPRCPI